MEIHQEELGDVQRYVDKHKDIPLDKKEHDFDVLLRYFQQFRTIDGSLNMLEVGTGMGWVPIIAKKRGWKLRGLEIAPGLIEAGREYGRRHGIEPDLVLGNIETYDLGENVYDVIIANSVFEHVENWRPGLERLYRALKPGGHLFFESTNKWSITSGELPSLEQQERRLLDEALKKTGGNQSEAARMLRISRDTLRYRMKKHGLGGSADVK